MGNFSSEDSVLVSPVCLPTWERLRHMTRRVNEIEAPQHSPRSSSPSAREEHGDKEHLPYVCAHVWIRGQSYPPVAGDDVRLPHSLLAPFDL